MSKLYPPYIDNNLPACFIDNDKIKLSIPFEMSRAVSQNEVKKMNIIIKTISTNIEKYIGELNIDWDKYIAFGDLDSNLFTVGQHYKCQIAYIDNNNNIGFYSTVGTFKCTAKPVVKISQLLSNEINLHQLNYNGEYENSDINEKVYYYQFIIKDSNGLIYDTSKKLLHNSLNNKIQNKNSIDVTYSSDNWIPEKNLQEGEQYTIQYIVTTINNLEFASTEYIIQNSYTIKPLLFNGELKATLFQDNGYIELSLLSNDNNNLNGQFLLTRSSSKDNFSSWESIFTFNLANNPSGLVLWKDFTIEQGIRYLYAIEMINNNGIHSSKIYNKEQIILADFEDMFLSDENCQLKIRFNPKITSFKSNFLESKLDTLGSQYPYFFRNGSVKYKEFPISGLLSLIGDENQLFYQNNKKENKRDKTSSEQDFYSSFYCTLDANNFQKEREFKLSVLEWLTNGEPKLFRSPGEGNYIIRLMNTNLSPYDLTSRMLHTFNSTAYEIDDYNFFNLKKYNFLKLKNNNINFGIKTVNINISQYNNTNNDSFIIDKEHYTITLPQAYNVTVKNTLPNSLIYINNINNPIKLSSNGSYFTSEKISKIIFSNYVQFLISTIEFTYEDVPGENNFNNITKVNSEILGPITFFNDSNNLIEDYMNNKILFPSNYNNNMEIGDIYYLYVYRRPIRIIERKNNNFYFAEIDNHNLLSSWDSKTFYLILDDDAKEYQGKIIDGYKTKQNNQITFLESTLDFTFKASGIDYFLDLSNKIVNNEDNYLLQNIGTLSSLICGNGLAFDIVYQLKTIEEE